MPQRILVVDDERTIRELVCEVLLDEGYEVAGAANGIEALTEVDKGSRLFDLVVLDMWMPVMNGWQFASALKERNLQLPIIVMTADREARERANDIGAIGYIGKPFDVDQFVEAIRRALPDSTPDRGDLTSDLREGREDRSVGSLLEDAANYAGRIARLTLLGSAQRAS